MAHSVHCSCGDVLSSEDEEELYRLARAHAVQLHHPVIVQATGPTSLPTEEGGRATVQRREGRVATRRDRSIP